MSHGHFFASGALILAIKHRSWLFLLAFSCFTSCVSSCCTTKWLSHTYTCLPSLLNLPPTSPQCWTYYCLDLISALVHFLEEASKLIKWFFFKLDLFLASRYNQVWTCLLTINNEKMGQKYWKQQFSDTGPESMCQCMGFLFFFLFFYWRIIDLQNFVVLCQTSTWISHKYTYIPSLLNLPPISLPIPPRFFTSWAKRETQEYWTYSLSSGSSWPRNLTVVSCIAGWFFTNWAISVCVCVYKCVCVCVYIYILIYIYIKNKK